MKWFNPVPATLEELKEAYRRLALKHHPDRGGKTADMQQINAEYDELFQRLKNVHTAANGTTYTTGGDSGEKAEDYREIIEALIHLDGIKIEICGSWIWISGNTRQHREALKTLHFRWSQSKKAWYYHADPYHKRSRKTLTLDEIRSLYGSQTINSDPQLRLKIV